MAAGNDDDEGGGGDGDPEQCCTDVCPGPGGRRSLEKALEEAASTGVLSLSGRRMKELPGSSRNHDLTDITRADLSKNRLSDVPADICQLVSLEFLNLYHNCLRSVPSAISNLQVLTYLNISRNLLSSLPPYLCRLPLTVLIASNNRLVSLPEEIGAMTNLRQLDVSCNDLQMLPSQMGSLELLRELNVRRNQLSTLPEELSELPLTRLDFSCNRVTHIPICYRHLHHLQTVILDNNPLQYPPAQICLKGKVHIFKYLNTEACRKPVSDVGGKLSRPTSFTKCLTDEIYSSRQYGCLDSGFNSVDSGSKRWSGNESADEFSDLSFRIAGFGGDAKLLREKQNGTEGDTEHVDFIDSSTNEEEEDAKSDCGLQMTVTPQDKRKCDLHSTPRTEEKTLVSGSAPSPTFPRLDLPVEERRRPETLLLWKEREKQQLLLKQESARRQSVDRRESIQKNLTHPPPAPSTQTNSDVANGTTENCTRLRSQGSQTGGPSNPTSPTSPCTGSAVGSSQKPSSFLFRSYSRGGMRSSPATVPSEQSTEEHCSPVRLRSSRPPVDEKALLAQLRKRDLCLASDILGGEHPLIVQRTVSSLLLLPPEEVLVPPSISVPLSRAETCPPHSSLLPQYSGFLLFYALLMLTLYAAYNKLAVF
ncbi:leucine-rich repeat and calponin homology domain-containing protein 4 [Rhinophrynus dorsalis]